jgi:hypothetical protein
LNAAAVALIMAVSVVVKKAARSAVMVGLALLVAVTDELIKGL